MTDQKEFLDGLRRSLGKPSGASARPPAPHREVGPGPDMLSAESIRLRAREQADSLNDTLEASASAAGWKVQRVASTADAATYIVELVRTLEARSLVRSAHAIVDRLGLEEALEPVGAGVSVAAADSDDDRPAVRQRMIDADIGVTGVDYAIAETGSCVIIPRKGVSRLASLLPPVHVAVVERGLVLPGLEELFALYASDFPAGAAGYMNIISGPSRSADIEYTLVTGVHGPGEVHMLLLG